MSSYIINSYRTGSSDVPGEDFQFPLGGFPFTTLIDTSGMSQSPVSPGILHDNG